MKLFLIKTVIVSTEMNDKVYKVFTESEWDAFQKTGRFNGSADDLKDGFIHLSTENQVAGVVERFFAGKHSLYLAEFSDSGFLQRLKGGTVVSGEADIEELKGIFNISSV